MSNFRLTFTLTVLSTGDVAPYYQKYFNCAIKSSQTSRMFFCINLILQTCRPSALSTFGIGLIAMLKFKLHLFDLLWICCTNPQLFNKSTTNPQLFNKSTTSRHVKMLWICCGLYSKSTTNRINGV
jgi:hypothetical protein